MKYQNVMLFSLGFLAITVQAETFEVGQTNNQFSKDALQISVGDTVKFKNNDTHFHNVFSLSDTQMFDLGSYPKGESREVKFTTPGEIEVECAIHPEMRMVIEVK